jgi:D-alanyl-D-alanine carboxypeptidase/D-alanyl-D-alanine-endopeptidase (penicillin-binding protein 4)
MMCGSLRAESDIGGEQTAGIPADIKAIFEKPIYKNSIWGLRVVDLESGRVLINFTPRRHFIIGSVRKLFSVGELLNQIGPSHRYNTPVYRRGKVDLNGVLHGDLFLVASGDLTMGGRTNPDGSIAVTDYDHNEADSLGNAQLTAPDPLAGYLTLAEQVANRGITEITGDVVIDDRLFQPFFFRGQFNLKPIFVNDDLVDLIINPTTPGRRAAVTWRPVSAALGVKSTLATSAAGSKYTLELAPEVPQCIGRIDCTAQILGRLPVDFIPPLTGKLPLIQAFRIAEPSNYARTVFIEALQIAGVAVNAKLTKDNPVRLLPPKNSYPINTKVAELKGMPYSDYAKFILKVSYNIGADTSLLLFGVARGVDNMAAALRAEEKNLITDYRIPPDEFHFVDGSGGGLTSATSRAVTQMLIDMHNSLTFPTFYNALPIMGVDGSLAFVTDFESDPRLAGAKGQVHAKPGTLLVASGSEFLVQGQAFGGYIIARKGKKLAYQVVVNNVIVSDLNGLLQIFQDEGTISAILWRDY